MNTNTGTDPGLFVGGDAPLRNDVTYRRGKQMFMLQNTCYIRKPQVISGEGKGAHPLHPSLLRSATAITSFTTLFIVPLSFVDDFPLASVIVVPVKASHTL